MLIQSVHKTGTGRSPIPIKPTFTYLGSGTTNNGQFSISNYSALFTYIVTGGSGTIVGTTLTVTVATGNATVAAVSPNGTYSLGTTAWRQAATQYFVQTAPFQCYSCGSPICCAPGCCGCGTCYYDSNNGFGAPGCYACCACGYYLWTNYGPQGYTWSGADYTNGQGEWWKVT